MVMGWELVIVATYRSGQVPKRFDRFKKYRLEPISYLIEYGSGLPREWMVYSGMEPCGAVRCC